MFEFNSFKQKLLPAQEDVLVSYIEECACHGFALDHQQIHETAVDLYAAHVGKEEAKVDPLGSNWVNYFLARHHYQLAGTLLWVATCDDADPADRSVGQCS